MDDWLSVHSHAYSKVYLLYGLVFTVNLAALVVLSINYCKSTYSLEFLEENDPDIDLSGLKSFSFDPKINSEYFDGMSNLGDTGKLYFDCFSGECEYKRTYSCTKEKCTGSGKNKKCTKYQAKCTNYYWKDSYKCSENCREFKSTSCSFSYCPSPSSSSSSYYSTKCKRNEETKKIDSTIQSCNADNLIMFWNSTYYRRSNRSSYKSYTYLNSAVPANESCPTGKKVCGILDNLGNKFCYPEYLDCPLNYISLDSNSSYTLDYSEIGNKKIYYSNEATENGKIVGGLFVDSELLIKYNLEDCEILDTNSVQYLLNDHYNKLYRNSLGYDPYTTVNEKVQNGKSYLKWCVPGVGKEKNISKIKELNVVYQFNVSTNIDIIKPIKNMFTASYFVALPAFIGMFFLLIIILFSFFEQNNINFSIGGFLRCSYTVNFIFLICIGVSCLLIIVSSILMIVNNGNISNATKLDVDVGIFKTLKSMNFVGLGICIGLFILIAVFVLYLFMTPTTYIDPKPDVNYQPYKDLYTSSINSEAKADDYKTSSDFNSTPTNNNNNNYNSSDFNNNVNTGYNSSDFNNNNAGVYNSSDFAGYAGGGNVYNPPLNPDQQQSAY